jgi:imidazolonepropionase-like amidohydrolase
MLKQIHTLSAICVLGALGGSSALAQDLTPRSRPQERPVAIVNATVHPASGPAIEGGFVAFDKGVITAIGKGEDAKAATTGDGWEVIDGKGMHVYPGLIGANTQLGIREIEMVRASRDTDEVGAVTPEVVAATALNPDSTFIPVTRSNGVLLAGVLPSGGAMPGRASVIRLEGWTPAEMTVVEDAGLVVGWPMARPVTAWWMDKSEEDQRKDQTKARRLIEDTLDAAKAYAAASAGADRPADIRLEAMRGLFAADPKAARPALILANEYDQIQQAVLACAARGVRCIIVGGRDAPLAAPLLKEHGAAVIVDGTIKFPKRDDSPYDDAYTLPARLEAAGVRWCLASGDGTPHERNLPYSAAMAVAHGLDHDAGVRSITLSAAEVLGIADRYGSLDKGKSATLIVTDGDVLEVSSNVRRAFIDGRAIDLSDKQKALREKYRRKYEGK